MSSKPQTENSAKFVRANTDKPTTNYSANNVINIEDAASSAVTSKKCSRVVKLKENVHSTLVDKKIGSENDKGALKGEPKVFSCQVYRLDPETKTVPILQLLKPVLNYEQLTSKHANIYSPFKMNFF